MKFAEPLATSCPAVKKPQLPTFHLIIQSVGATGGVYKGQGRNQRELMTHAY